MAEIIPAIIPQDIYDLRERLDQVAGEAPVVQIDVLDGKLTRTPSWPYKKKDDIYFAQILEEEEGLPHWQDVDFEIDLMVYDPLEAAKIWIAAGAERLIIHSSSKNAVEAIKKLRGDYPKGEEIGIELGFALDPDASLEILKEVIDDIDVIQVMGIDHIGFQGESFNEHTLGKIGEIRAEYPNQMISVDGGVRLDNARELIDAGADRLIVGSAIFESDNVHDMIRQLREV